MRNNKGFTLIELMIVVAIVGILTAVAVPAYQDYMVRARVTEGISLASAAKLAVEEYYQSNNAFPATQAATGYITPTATANVTSVAVTAATGVIVITYTAAAKSVVISLTPAADAAASGVLTWTCAVDAAANNKYVPQNCRV